MGSKKTIGVILLVGGILVLLLSVFAYPLGLGEAAFGPRQITGTVAGAIVTIVGLFLTLKG